MNVIWGMGAEHTTTEKLTQIVNQMEQEYMLLHTPYISNQDQMDRVGDLYSIHPHFMYDRLSYIAEEKYDGWSYLAEQGEFISRDPSTAKGKEGTPVIKTANIDSRIVEIQKLLWEHFGADIQGEIYFPGGTSDDVTRILGCTPEKGQERLYQRMALNQPNMHFVMIDIRSYNGKDVRGEPWYIRRALLEWVYQRAKECFAPDMDTYCPVAEIVGMPRQAFSRIVRAGGEGLVIKNTKAIYQSGKKPANTWIKAKKSLVLDVFITGLRKDGTGKNAELFRSLEVAIVDEAGKIKPMGTVHSGISDEMRVKIFDTWPQCQYVVMEIEAMDLTPKGFRHGRFIRFRHDKTWMECTGETHYMEELI